MNFFKNNLRPYKDNIYVNAFGKNIVLIAFDFEITCVRYPNKCLAYFKHESIIFKYM